MRTLLHRILRTAYPHRDPLDVKRAYGLPEEINLNVRLSDDGWFVVSSPEFPGLVTQARDRDELIEMVNDAVLTHFDVPKREADIVYDRFRFGDQVVQYRAKLQTQTA